LVQALWLCRTLNTHPETALIPTLPARRSFFIRPHHDGKGPPAGFAIHVEPNGNQRKEPLFRVDGTMMRQVPAVIDLGPENEVVILELYGTGLRGRSAQSAVSVTIGGIAATVEYADRQPDFGGLDQVNVRIPRVL
jgi:hypothetical protein